MASQFSKSESSSSSISNSNYDYDVFLSFCREDVGKSFADHLYAALVKKGLHPFREPVSASESLMAIEKSKAFVVIFSRNYADHLTYLLPELVEIIRRGKPVVPVFYNVESSEVQKQSGSYGKAFAEYEAEHGKERADCWRTALTEASNLSGYHLDHWGYEQTIIMEITNFIVKILRRQYVDGDYLVGIDKSLQELMSIIGIGFDDVRMVGVYGIGGIGKTTTVEALYNLISCQFDGASFLRNVREQSILQLQKQLLLDITGEEDKNLNDVDKAINMMKRKLRQKKVLIVVDDVDCSGQLEYLVPDRDLVKEVE